MEIPPYNSSYGPRAKARGFSRVPRPKVWKNGMQSPGTLQRRIYEWEEEPVRD